MAMGSEATAALGIARASALVAAAAYAWWASGLRPFTAPALLATMAAGVVAIVVGTRRRSPAVPPTALGPGLAVWAVLLLALGAWELAAFLQHPRADHPTLSSIAGGLLEAHPARAAAFLLWLALGLDLARR
jgi:hypothetical protein